MKNVTLSMPEDLLRKSREYAKKNGTTLNQMIRDFLKRNVECEDSFSSKQLIELTESISFSTKDLEFDRDKLHER